MTLIVRGAARLVPVLGAPIRGPAALVVRDGRVAWTGPEAQLPPVTGDVEELDVGGACVIPGFVDAHTHLVFAGSRREEFVARLAGQPYDGGGIRTTVAATRAASDEELLQLAHTRLRAAMLAGTTTLEIKTGYGLSTAQELRLLDIVGRLAATSPARIEATYLGAHVVPEERERADYVDEVVATLPAARAHGARWCDVFCDRGVFTIPETRRILEAAQAAGLGLRLHAEEIAHTGAAALAAEFRCASADHLEHVTEADAVAMASAGVVGVLLPTVTLTLGGHSWDHASRLRAAGVELALATDCNPGTSWCESMPYAIQLGCLAMGLSVEEALRAATLGGAHALRRDDVGQLAVGARADLAILEAEHEADLVAHLGAARPVRTTVVGGVVVEG